MKCYLKDENDVDGRFGGRNGPFRLLTVGRNAWRWGSMSNIRREGLRFLEKRLGRIRSGHVAVSKYYPPKESWTRSPIWWFDLPLNKLRDPSCHQVHLLCQDNEGEGFYYLCILVSFLLENLNSLDVVQKGRQRSETVRLYVSARREDHFRDLRGSGRVDFARWRQG